MAQQLSDISPSASIEFSNYLLSQNKAEIALELLKPLINRQTILKNSIRDSILYQAAKAEFQLGHWTEARDFFNAMKDSSSKLFKSQIIYQNFISLKNFESPQNLSSFEDSMLIEVNRIQHLAWSLLTKDSDAFIRLFKSGKCNIAKLNTIEFNLYLAYLDLLKVPKKKYWKAIALSAVFPGLGKFYAGNKREAVSTFLPILFNGIQSYEGYRKNGLKSPNFYIFGGIGLVFYLSNIRGTSTCLKRKINEHYEKINLDIDAQISVLTAHFSSR